VIPYEVREYGILLEYVFYVGKPQEAVEDITHALTDHSGYHRVTVERMPARKKLRKDEVVRCLPTLVCLPDCEGRDRRFYR
jgi:hypothetical protein